MTDSSVALVHLSAAQEAGVARRCAAEALGTGVLVAVVIGSGIMATRLTDDVAIQLLVNALATVGALGVLIAVLGPITGAHFNPLVSLVLLVHRDIKAFFTSSTSFANPAVSIGRSLSDSFAGIAPTALPGFITAQLLGAAGGAALAIVLFPRKSMDQPQRASSARSNRRRTQ